MFPCLLSLQSIPADDPTDPTAKSPTTPGSKERRRSLLPTLKTSPRSPQEGCCDDAFDVASTSKAAHLKTGDRVCLGGVKQGVLRYLGETKFAGGDWCGVELDDTEGKHNGSVDGVSYFTCADNHGIFAPRAKVEPALKYEADTARRVSKSPSPSSETSSKLRQPRVSNLPQPTPHQQSVSPEPKRKKTTSESDDPDLSPSAPNAKPRSRLVKLKAVPKSLESARRADDATPSSSRESSPGSRDRDTADSLPNKPSKLPLGGKRVSSIPKLGSLKKQPLPGTKENDKDCDDSVAFGETFVIDSKLEEDDDDDDTVVTTPSRVDSRVALTLTYDLDGSGSDSELSKQRVLLNQSYKVNKTFTVDNGNEERGEPGAHGESLSPGTLQSSIPDLLTPPGQDLYAKKEPPFETDTDLAIADKDVESDFLAHSRASSLGLLTDQDLYNNSLLSSGFGIMTDQEPCSNSLVAEETKLASPKEPQLRGLVPREVIDLPEREIDQEISGISTPEIDLSSGKEVASSPEPDLVRHEFDLSFDLKPGQTSTPVSPARQLGAAASGGEKMATPVRENGFIAGEKSHHHQHQHHNDAHSANANSTYTVETKADATYCLTENATDRDIEPMDVDHVQVNQTYTAHVQRRDRSEKSCAESSDDSEEYPKRMRTSADLDEVDIDLMSASFELAKTAVAQYADLVKGSEVVRAHIKELNQQSQLTEDSTCEQEQEQSADSATSDSDSDGFTAEDNTPIAALDLIKDTELHALVKLEDEEEEDKEEGLSSSQNVQTKAGVQDGDADSVQIEDVDPKVMIASGHAIDLGQQLEDDNDNDDDRLIPPQILTQDSFVGSVDSLEDVGADGAVQGRLDHDLEDADQLIADLQEGHRRTERPTSMISSCSADTGIVADVTGTGGDTDRKERPVSLISTSSVDTGTFIYSLNAP